MEPITRGVRLIGVDEYAEDLDRPELPPPVEAYFAWERACHRLLRGTGLVTAEEAAQGLRRWVERDSRT